MGLSRRDWLKWSASAAALGVAGRSWAQEKVLFEQLNMFIPAGPGGGWDSTGRAIEDAAKKGGLVSSFQFENVGGAGGMVGLPRFVASRKGQGNALMVGGSVMVGAGITNKSPVTIKNVVPIARLTEEAGVLVVPAQGAIKTWKDFVAALRADPKAVSVAGGSAGGTDHQLLGLILQTLGKNPKEAGYVAYAGGGQAVAAILGAQVAAGISGYSEFDEHIKSGRMIALAVSGEKRIPGVNIPTLKELGSDVVLTNWRGVFAAPEISDADRNKLEMLLQKTVQTPAWRDSLAKNKWTDVFLSGKAFEADIARSLKDSEMVLKELGLA